ncbi:MAG: beta strand repeat-containing protein, partial [Dolichospermum sp.]
GTPIAGTTTTNALTICNGNALHLGLTGNTTGIGITYQWQFSTNNTNWSNLTSELSAPDFDTVQTETRYYRAAVSCNGNAPSYSTSVLVSTPALVSGTYTINSAVSTGGSNFQTFADAVSYISCGVDGPVVFNVEPSSGPYNEQIAIPAINGASAINTITFNGNGNTLAFSSTNTSNRAVVTLNGADYIRLDNFTINSAGGTFGWAVFFTGQADNNIVSNCNIQGDLSATSTNFAGIVFSTSFTSATTTGNNIGNNNIISNNTINGGYYGITLCGGSTSLGTNNQVINNIFTNQYVYPVYTIYQSGALVNGNDISRPTRTSVSTGYGCYLTTGVINSRFEKNRIHNLFDQATTSTSTAYAFYVAADGTAGNENKIINNLVYSLGGNGTHYGVYNTTGAYLQIYHNTFVLEGTVATSGATYGIYQTGTISGFDVKNNNISVTRSGTGIKRCLAFVTTTSAVTSNGNNLYMNAASGTDNNLCAWGTTAYANLTLWKAVNTNAFDQNSVSVNPNFVNAASGNYSPTALAVNNVGLNIGVTDDILGTLRSGNFSAGCYQNDVTAPAINYTALTTDCGPSQSTGVTLSNVVISDFTGVPTSGSTVPRIYYKKGVNGTWNSAAGTFSSSWSFTINYASIAGLTNGDSIYYYVAAQDLAAIPNVVSSPAGAVGTSVNNITSHPTANYFRAITYTPSITISTLTNSICSGNTTTFTAVSVDGGTSPVYDWRRNNISVGSGSSIDFYGGTLNTGDIITCVLTANNACQTISTVTSNSILLIVKPSPVVAQTTNQAGTAVTAASICTLGNAGITRFGNSTPFGTWSSSNSSVATVNNQGYVTGISNGTATISYTLASTNGCVVASNVLLNVAPVTTPNVITGASSVCAGSSITLSNTTPNGVWSTAQTSQATINAVTGNLLGKSAGFVTVNYTVTNAAGCSALVNKTITVNALPAVPTIAYAPGTQLGGPASPFYGAPSGSFCVGKVFTLVGTPNVPAGVWSATGAASITSGGVVTVNSVGVGTVKYTYTNTNGCVNSRTLSASGFTCASRGTNVEELAISSTDFTMYPNPARSVISLQVDKLIGGGSIVVTDLYGKAVKTQPLSMGTNNINVSSLSKGVYLVSVINNDGKTTKKLVVE